MTHPDDMEMEVINGLLSQWDPDEFEALHDQCQPIGCDVGVHLPGCKYEVEPT